MTKLDSLTTSPKIAKSGTDIAILPIGATEQHGPHLPLCTDASIAEAISTHAADRLNAYLLPTIPYGNSEVHEGYRGSISIQPETLQALVLDICQQLQSQGFRKIVIINGHGGNFILRIAIRKVNYSAPPGFKVLLIEPHIHFASTLKKVIETYPQEVHAGEYETSMMLHLMPEQVGDERPDCVTDFGAEMYNYALTREITDQGVWGVSSKGTAEKGEQVLKLMVNETVQYIESTFEKITELKA
ncbi:MAG TPA: creatininase family protein [Anaerolineales bacterium]|nr:creatininase family protein [Anaerolineales bacterium]